MTKTQEDFLWALATSSDWLDAVAELSEYFPEVDWAARRAEEERKITESRKEWRDTHPEEAKRQDEMDKVLASYWLPRILKRLESNSALYAQLEKKR